MYLNRLVEAVYKKLFKDCCLNVCDSCVYFYLMMRKAPSSSLRRKGKSSPANLSEFVMERAILQAPASQSFEGKSDSIGRFQFSEGRNNPESSCQFYNSYHCEGKSHQTIKLDGSFLYSDTTHSKQNSPRSLCIVTSTKRLTNPRRSLSQSPLPSAPDQKPHPDHTSVSPNRTPPPPKKKPHPDHDYVSPSLTPKSQPIQKENHTHQVPLLPPEVPSHHTRLRFPQHAIAPSIAPSHHHRSSPASRLLRQGVGVAR